MVKRVATPVEHHLITNASYISQVLAAETLNKFTIKKLLDSKFTSKNFRAGLDFTDSYKARTSRNKLSQMMVKTVEKEIPFLRASGVLSRDFLMKPIGGEGLRVRTFYDKAVLRYVRRATRFLNIHNIPVSIFCYEYVSDDQIEIQIGAGGNSRTSTLGYYRILSFLPEISQFFKTLSRKAVFTDENAKANNRSKPPSSISRSSAGPNNRGKGSVDRTRGSTGNPARA